ncbi:MAG: sigma-54 dependent transcriptional regulator [Alphaproteobacteria bacterium]|nr:sigma-54 dependent transcriptional regulator [Alphaproteobacteria bacterium]MCY4318262.1 sigma-54 dependent transcriptional regulator [Alphaproteobacteria bacterium]
MHDILIVDDEQDIRQLIAGVLEDEGFEARSASNSDGALEELQKRQPSVLLLDVWLEGSRLSGMDLLRHIRKRHHDLPILMISGHGSIETAVAAIRDGAYDFVEKPFTADRLLLAISRAIEAFRLRRENAELRLHTDTMTELIGRSSEISQMRSLIERVAPTGSRVLIQGPPGSGKEVAARMIHNHSRRSEGPFVVVNCAIMAPTRLEEELFGSEEGAGKTGLLERSHGGTLLLDEIVDMPAETQGKIVRVLQEQTFLRVGGTNWVSVDVRVIATSNRNLVAEMAQGRMRQDLFYRLNVVPLEIAPLRRRREDIPLLVDHFLELYARRVGATPPAVADDAMAALQAYDWPGNVRELRNIVERLSILALGEGVATLRASALPPELSKDAPIISHFERGDAMMALPLREARDMFEREYLLAQMRRFGNNISQTAQFIGMDRSTLHRKLRAFDSPHAAEQDRQA